MYQLALVSSTYHHTVPPCKLPTDFAAHHYANGPAYCPYTNGVLDRPKSCTVACADGYQVSVCSVRTRPLPMISIACSAFRSDSFSRLLARRKLEGAEIGGNGPPALTQPQNFCIPPYPHLSLAIARTPPAHSPAPSRVCSRSPIPSSAVSRVCAHNTKALDSSFSRTPPRGSDLSFQQASSVAAVTNVRSRNEHAPLSHGKRVGLLRHV